MWTRNFQQLNDEPFRPRNKAHLAEGTLRRRFRWPADNLSEGEGNEAHAYPRSNGRSCGLCDEAATAASNADLRGRDANPSDDAVPAAAAAATASTSCHDDVSERNLRPGRCGLPDSASTAAASAARRRTRLSHRGRSPAPRFRIAQWELFEGLPAARSCVEVPAVGGRGELRLHPVRKHNLHSALLFRRGGE